MIEVIPPTPVQMAVATREFLTEPYGPATRAALLATDHTTVVAIAMGCRSLLDQLSTYLIPRMVGGKYNQVVEPPDLASWYSNLADGLDRAALEREYGDDESCAS